MDIGLEGAVMVIGVTGYNDDGIAIPPTIKGRAHCKCGALLYAHSCTSEKMVPHWVHWPGTLSGCDTWFQKKVKSGEGKTLWHMRWQDLLAYGHSEAAVTNISTGQWHLADCIGNNGRVLEFQHSLISIEEMVERSQFYSANATSMDWIVDADGGKTPLPGWDYASNIGCNVYLHYRDRRLRLRHNGGLTEPMSWSTLYYKYFSDVLTAEREDYYEFASYVMYGNYEHSEQFMEGFWYPEINIPIKEEIVPPITDNCEIVKECWECAARAYNVTTSEAMLHDLYNRDAKKQAELERTILMVRWQLALSEREQEEALSVAYKHMCEITKPPQEYYDQSYAKKSTVISETRHGTKCPRCGRMLVFKVNSGNSEYNYCYGCAYDSRSA